jgi:ribosomal protein S18 acetylase RimI-like enzyme
MIFRKAKTNDLEQLLTLEQKVVEAERPYNTSIKIDKPKYYDIDKLISENDSNLLVAEVNSEIIASGYAQIQLSKESLEHERHAYYGFMYVSPDYRGKGINKKLIDRLVVWSKERGVNDHYLEVYSGNSPAIRAYEKLGFEPCLIEMKLKT